MPAKEVTSCTIIVLDRASVEVDISRGLPLMTIVGLSDIAVQESWKRVHAVIKNSGLPFPSERLTVKLAPANLRKDDPAYDLPIAIGILLASEQIYGDISQAIVMGEMLLDGSVRHMCGALPMANLAPQEKYTTLFVPTEDAFEASLFEEELIFYPLESLLQSVDHLMSHKKLTPYRVDFSLKNDDNLLPFAAASSEIKGREPVNRVLEIAMAGNHNMLMAGLPGAEKTLIAHGRPGILPDHRPFHSSHQTVTTLVWSVASLVKSVWLIEVCSFWMNCQNLSEVCLDKELKAVYSIIIIYIQIKETSNGKAHR